MTQHTLNLYGTQFRFEDESRAEEIERAHDLVTKAYNVGPSTGAKVVKEFGDLAGLHAATVGELADVEGVGQQTAERIYDAIQEHEADSVVPATINAQATSDGYVGITQLSGRQKYTPDEAEKIAHEILAEVEKHR